jgi:hypothetical protein
MELRRRVPRKSRTGTLATIAERLAAHFLHVGARVETEDQTRRLGHGSAS